MYLARQHRWVRGARARFSHAPEALTGIVRRTAWPVPELRRWRRAVTAAGKRSLGGWALAENALRALILSLETDRPTILEFGSGVSTSALGAYFPEGRIHAFEHDAEFAERLRPRLPPNAVVRTTGLWDWSPEDFEALLGGRLGHGFSVYAAGFASLDGPVDEFVERAAFYRLSEPLPPDTYDVCILDGPHGRGRSAAFRVAQNSLKPGALVLIDDCTHYPFVDACARVFHIDVIDAEIYPSKQWILLKVTPRP